MFKRCVLWICVAAVFVSSCFVVVSAEDQEVDGYTVVNYEDYITGYDLFNASDGWAYIRFADDMFTSYKEDVNGWKSSTNGSRLWNISVKNDQADFSAYVTSQIPGGGINGTFLDLSNVPDGSEFHIQAIADLDDYAGYQSELLITIFSGIKYYDKDFKYISGYHDEENTYSFSIGQDEDDRFSQVVEIPIKKPEDAVYGVLYSRVEFGTGRSNDYKDYINVSVQFLEPNLKISTSYTQIIINAIVNAKLPDGHGSIVSVGELEAILNGSLQGGHQSAEDIFISSSDVIHDFLSGFSFMKIVFTSLFNNRFINSILIVSLSLGLFGFIVNSAASIGRSLEHKSRNGGGKK